MSGRGRRELGTFADALAHRLATPARIVSGNVRILGERSAERDDPEAAEALAAIGRASRWISGIVDGLTRYSHIADPPQEHERVDARDEAQHAIELLSGQIAAAGAIVVVGRLPVVGAEPQALRTLFRYLLDNAIRAQSGRAPAIAIACEREPSAWHITVSDDGDGVDGADRERVFEPFVSIRDGGAGLGLTLARDIVERHDGRIWLDGRPGGGTTVHVLWPGDDAA